MSSKAASESGSRGPNIRFIIESALMIALITGVALGSTFTKPVDYGEKIFDDVAVALDGRIAPLQRPVRVQ